MSSRRLRIGELAELTGTTTRTIRYYEELGLLPPSRDREPGRHRTYDEHDVERVREVLKLKELLGLSLEELASLLEAESARAALREEWRRGHPDAARRREILEESLSHIARQLDLLRGRREQMERLESELVARRRRVRDRLRQLEREPSPA